MDNTFIYADNAATTPVRREVLEAMIPWFSENFGNASALYLTGRRARKAVENTRALTAELLGADKEEIFFTSGGTEGDNTALRGIDYGSRRHIVVSAFEHHAVLNTAKYLEKQGIRVTYLRPDRTGHILPNALRSVMTTDTALVSIMAVNNELGTVQPIEELAGIAHEYGALFHTDAVQAAGHMKLDMYAMGIDMAVISAHKFCGPKGIGVLYKRRGIELEPLIYGGGQERRYRSGTENVAGIVGLGESLRLALDELEEVNERLLKIRERLISGLLEIPVCHLNGSGDTLPGIMNFSFAGLVGENISTLMGRKNVYVSPGSACASGQHEPSHVLVSIGLPPELSNGGLRISLGRDNRLEDADAIIDAAKYAVDFLKRLG